MPIKLFQDGEILDASDVNTYFMDQALIVFEDSDERDAAFGGFTGTAPNIVLTEPALGVENKGRICYLKDDNKIYIWSGTEWTPQLALIEEGVVTSANILNGTIMNIDINASALIAHSKLANATAGQVLLGTTTTGVVTATTLSGDVTVNGAGVTALASNLTLAGNVTGNPAAGTVSTGTSGFGYMGLPQNATTTSAYRLVAADAGKHIYSTATRTITIPGNATGNTPQVAFPVGTTIVFVAGSGATLTLSMDGTTTDTCLLAGPGTSMTGGTGSRTLAAFGMATLLKITATSWIISGNGLT
jgi:hypothetical protein